MYVFFILEDLNIYTPIRGLWKWYYCPLAPLQLRNLTMTYLFLSLT